MDNITTCDGCGESYLMAGLNLYCGDMYCHLCLDDILDSVQEVVTCRNNT